MRTRALAPLLPAVVVLLLLGGCGSSDPTGTKGSDKPSASATATGSAAPDAEQADADGMKTVTVQGISFKVPATWTAKHEGGDEDLYFWKNPGKGERDGLVAIAILNSTQTAEDYVAQMTGKDGSLEGVKIAKKPVDVPGMGRGYQLVSRDKRSNTDRLVVSTMDGLQVELIFVADPDPAHSGYSDIVLSSMKREL